MDLHVAVAGRRDLAGQIYRQVKASIMDGQLGPGEALPASRELAGRLGISRNTVTVAYDRLTAEGFLSARVGAGTYVSGLRRVQSSAGPLRPRAVWDGITPWAGADPAEFDFRAGVPDEGLFPYQTWRRLIGRQLQRPVRYSDAAGYRPLREAIADHIGTSRGVVADVDDVLITGGVQQALDLVGRVLLEPGELVAVEDPGYPPPRMLFETMGVRVAGIPVDDEGLVVDALPDDARLVYVSPAHQFPLGMPMSLERRMALLAWAERRDAVIVEDDYDTEFRFGGRPIETLRSLDRGGRVVYVGSFSKTLLPSLRLGFLVAPRSLREALVAARYVTDRHSPLPEQAALAGFISTGLFSRHVRKMRNVYQARHDLITSTLEKEFAPWLRPVPCVAGLHVSAVFHDDSVDDTAVRADGVEFFPLSRFFYQQPARPGIVLGYGAVSLAKVAPGMERLRATLG